MSKQNVWGIYVIDLILKGFLETVAMVTLSAALGFVIGTPIALFLWIISPVGLTPKPFWHKVNGFIINALRSIPYIIFMVLLLPLTRLIVGTSIGTLAATLPLSLAAILLYIRLAEDIFETLPKGLVEAGKTMGATKKQILIKIVFSESLPQLAAALTNLTVMLIGFSAMAGAVGGGGLGDLAIRYGYQRYDLLFLGVIVLVLVLMVQCVQMLGNHLVQKLRS